MISERRREYMRKYRAEHREEVNARQRNLRAEHRDEVNARKRNLRAERREDYRFRQRNRRAEHRDEVNARQRKYHAEDLNKNGVTKNHIRVMSRKILEKCHTKLLGYQIHHCFGYEDPEKFIYIPKSLHIQIHQLLRDKKIPANSDHWFTIRELVNSCEEYTYIRA